VQQSGNEAPSPLNEPAAGVLYLVGTPIGNRADLSPRARAVLAAVDHLACEDTRRSGLLLQALGLKRSLISFHQHNQASRIPQLLEWLAAGQSVAVISDAGLPGISDPGEALVAAAREQGRPVICVPGPCAITTALVSSGLPCDRFCFEGFLPPKAAQRRQRLRTLATEERTLVVFEAPHRLIGLLEDVLAELGDRPLRVARELTKRHEEQVGSTVAAALAHFRAHPPLGECTVVLGGAPSAAPAWEEEPLREAMAALLAEGLSAREASQQLAQRTGHRRRDLYALLHRPEVGESGEPLA
jgi:16S rRNA (cytidine1402-2'-O)-methyltransferase